METKLLELFEGDSTQHLEVTLTGGLDERGKKQAKYTALLSHFPLENNDTNIE